VCPLFDASGFAHRYLPRYSPDLNPIEPTWAKLNSLLGEPAARMVNGLQKTLSKTLAFEIT
jgi:transposase